MANILSKKGENLNHLSLSFSQYLLLDNQWSLNCALICHISIIPIIFFYFIETHTQSQRERVKKMLTYFNHKNSWILWILQSLCNQMWCPSVSFIRVSQTCKRQIQLAIMWLLLYLLCVYWLGGNALIREHKD